MANPAELTVTSLVANDMTAQPAGDTIDSDGTVPINSAGRSDLLLMEVTSGIADLVVTLLHGDNPPAFRAGLGDVAHTLALAAVGVFGPFEAARFMQSDGSIDVKFEVEGAGEAAATVRTYRLPRTV